MRLLVPMAPVAFHELVLSCEPVWVHSTGERQPDGLHLDHALDELVSIASGRRSARVHRLRLSTGEQTGIASLNTFGTDALTHDGAVLITTDRKLWRSTMGDEPPKTIAAPPGTGRLLLTVDQDVVLAHMADLVFVHVPEGRVVRRRTPSSFPSVLKVAQQLLIVDKGGAVMVPTLDFKLGLIGAIGPVDDVFTDEFGRTWAFRGHFDPSTQDVVRLHFADGTLREVWRRPFPRSASVVFTTCGPLLFETVEPSGTYAYLAPEIRGVWVGAEPDADEPIGMTGFEYLCLRVPGHGSFTYSAGGPDRRWHGYVARLDSELIKGNRPRPIATD